MALSLAAATAPARAQTAPAPAVQLQQAATLRTPDPVKAVSTRPDGAPRRAGGYMLIPSPNARAAALSGLEDNPARGIAWVECRLDARGGLDRCATRLSPPDAAGRPDAPLEKALAALAALYRFEGVDFAATSAGAPIRLTFSIGPSYRPGKPPVIELREHLYGLKPLPPAFRLIFPTPAQLRKNLDPIPVASPYDVRVSVNCGLDARGAAHACVAAGACQSPVFVDTARTLASLYTVAGAPKARSLSLTFAFYSSRSVALHDPGGFGELVDFGLERQESPCPPAPPAPVRP